MIKITKGDCPQVLIDQASAWTEALNESIRLHGKASDSAKSKYRHADIKAQIVSETHGKCAYCEAKLLHSQYGDIEHYVPKSLEPERAFEWSNLTLACKVCNTLKSDRDPHSEHLIDPYGEDPEIHLDFCGALVFPNGTQKGIETKSILSLNRAELCERRKESLERLLGLIEKAQNPHLSVASRRAIYEDFVNSELANGAQFAAMARALHKQIRGTVESQWAA